jgi:AcrR family transcriptional regulator
MTRKGLVIQPGQGRKRRASLPKELKLKRLGAEVSSPWPTTQDREENRRVKREAVLRAAGQLFVEHGFHATSLDDIAARLNVTKPTLYYYVKNKDEILFECVRTGLEKLHDAMERIRQAGGRPIDRLIAGIRSYVEIVTQDFGLCVIRIGEDPLPPAGRLKLRRMKGLIDREFRSVIKEAIDAGSLAENDPRLAAFAVAGMLSWIGRWYRPDGEYTPTQIADRFITILVHGLGRREAMP